MTRSLIHKNTYAHRYTGRKRPLKDIYELLLSDNEENEDENASIDEDPISFQLLNDLKTDKKRCYEMPIYPRKIFASLVEYATSQYKEKAKLDYVPERYEAASNRTYWHKKTSGESRLKHLRSVLDEFGYTRTDQQKIFHEHMINSCLPIAFGNELQFHIERILKENNWTEIMQELLCVTPRRFGKTWAVAMFIAAVLICLPYVEVVVFSMAMRASRKMLALVDKFLSRHEEGNQMICRPHNQEKLTLRGDSGPDDIRTCLSLPGRSDVVQRVTLPPLFLSISFFTSYFLLLLLLLLLYTYMQ